jgi:hypothetical protein
VSVPAASGVTIPGTSLPGVHAGAGKPTLP